MSKGNHIKQEQNGAELCHFDSSNEQMLAEGFEQEKNKRDHGYSVCSLHQKEVALDQYK